MPVDGFGRKIDYLRLSVTDRCNFRCQYCLPIVYGNYQPAENILTDDEIVEVVNAFALEGFKKIRITGGEPLARPGLPGLVGRISAIPGITEVSLSTNGMLLGRYARALAAAGLARVNISVDTLKPDKFKDITRYGDIRTVLEGLEAAREAGLDPIKINCVVIRGVNDDEIAAFSAMTDDRPLHVRFIELMPMGAAGFFSNERRMGRDDMIERAGPLKALARDEGPVGNGPARYYRRPGARGTVGFVTALSGGFCEDCNRVRLTATGTLVPCLDGEDGIDLRVPLRSGADSGEIRRRITAAIAGKPEKHHMVERAREKTEGSRYMCSIGG